MDSLYYFFLRLSCAGMTQCVQARAHGAVCGVLHEHGYLAQRDVYESITAGLRGQPHGWYLKILLLVKS